MVNILEQVVLPANHPAPEAGEEIYTARRYASLLQHSVGAAQRPLQLVDEHPALSWTRSGLLNLTGRPDGPGLMCPAPLAACAEGALAALKSLAPSGALENLSGAALLGERAALLGHTRRGRVSPGSSCRLLAAADGTLALNLARADDWALLPAWLEQDVAADWDAVETVVRERALQPLVERGRELGLALAPSRLTQAAAIPVLRAGTHARPSHRPRVIELASLWAGPLCGRLLQHCGAEVIKVESTSRPDGARLGPPAFFDRMNAGKHSLMLDLTQPEGVAELLRLIRGADIVIEGSRPRALRQLGIHAEALCAENPALTWLSLTGHGRGEPQEHWVAYGDDAGVAAGLSQLMRESCGEEVIVGDAIADPLTGVHAALAAWARWQRGGGGTVALALSQVVSQCINFEAPETLAAWRERQRRWSTLAA